MVSGMIHLHAGSLGLFHNRHLTCHGKQAQLLLIQTLVTPLLHLGLEVPTIPEPWNWHR